MDRYAVDFEPSGPIAFETQSAKSDLKSDLIAAARRPSPPYSTREGEILLPAQQGLPREGRIEGCGMGKKPKKPEGVPLESIFLEKGFQRNFEIEMRSVCGDPALKHLILSELASNAKTNVLNKEGQRKKSSLPRPKKNEFGDTRNDVIRKLVRQHPEESIGALWTHFRTALAEWSDSEVRERNAGQGRSYRYEMDNKVQSIAIETFRKVVRIIRKENGI